MFKVSGLIFSPEHDILVIIGQAARSLILAYRLFAVDDILLQGLIVLLAVISGSLHTFYMVEVTIPLYLAAVL